MPPNSPSIFLHILSISQFFGVFINLFQLLILFQKELRSNAIYRLMTWICLFDILSQASTFLTFSPFWIRETDDGCFVTRTYQDILFYFYGMVSFEVFQRVSTWLAVTIGIFEVMKSSKKTKTLSTVLALLLLSIVWTYLVYFQNEVEQMSSDKDCSGTQIQLSELRFSLVVVEKHKRLYDRIQNIDKVVKILPVILEMILLFVMIKNEKETCKEDQLKRENIARLIIIFTVPYILTGLPNTVVDILKALIPENPVTVSLAQYINILPVLNSISHFFICILVSPQCQNGLRILFGKRPRTDHVVQVAMASKRNSVIPQDDVSGFAFTIE
ncbi:unnamed protein product [Caenorhabditis brenneri]